MCCDRKLTLLQFILGACLASSVRFVTALALQNTCSLMLWYRQKTQWFEFKRARTHRISIYSCSVAVQHCTWIYVPIKALFRLHCLVCSLHVFCKQILQMKRSLLFKSQIIFFGNCRLFLRYIELTSWLSPSFAFFYSYQVSIFKEEQFEQS